MENEKIGKFISLLRKEKKLTQKELADKLNITDRAVSKWERGINCPDISLLEELSNILDVSVIELLKGKRNPNYNISNKEIIETLNYTKKEKNKKILKIANCITLAIISIILMIIVITATIDIIKVSKKYTFTYNLNEEVITYNTNNKELIDIIKNNQGIYSNEEYNEILNYVNTIELLDNNYIRKLDNQKYINLSDINNLKLVNLDNNIYNIILNYDLNKYNNLINYIRSNYLKLNMRNMLDEGIIYLKTNNIQHNFINMLYVDVYSINILLKDIIEVGDIHE